MHVMESFRLDGKTALVTGCRRGIGRAIARGLAEAGADVVGVSAQMEDSGSLVETEVIGCGRKFMPHSCDFSDRSALYEFIARVKSDEAHIDILVNNAGIIRRKPVAEHPDEWWDEVLEVNLSAQFVLAREFGRDMVEQGAGKIVFIASLLSFQGGIMVPGYAASKGALATLTMALANEWAGRGVNVNGIAPGYIVTDNTEALRQDVDRSRQLLERIPAARFGEADEIAGAVVYLCSPAASYVNGALLTIDGGWMGR